MDLRNSSTVRPHRNALTWLFSLASGVALLSSPACVVSVGDGDSGSTGSDTSAGQTTGTAGSSSSTGDLGSTGSDTTGMATATGMTSTGSSTTDPSTTTGGSDSGTAGESGSTGADTTGGDTCGKVDFFVPGRTGCAAYDACAQANCEITGRYCMGTEFWSGGAYDPTRPCGEYVPCVFGCDCADDPTACVQACGGAAELTCLPCLGDFNSCAKENCGEVTDHCPE